MNLLVKRKCKIYLLFHVVPKISMPLRVFHLEHSLMLKDKTF